jgi:hypothetical protein
MYTDMEDIAVEARYRERVELLGALRELSWFDNFGECCYQDRMWVVYQIDQRTGEIPVEHMSMVKEAREVWGHD